MRFCHCCDFDFLSDCVRKRDITVTFITAILLPLTNQFMCDVGKSKVSGERDSLSAAFAQRAIGQSNVNYVFCDVLGELVLPRLKNAIAQVDRQNERATSMETGNQ